MTEQVDTQATPTATDAPAHGVVLTDLAAAKVKSLLEQEGRDDLAPARRRPARRLLRSASTSSTSTSAPSTATSSRDFDGVEVVVDRMSAPYLDGATIDFADTIEKQGFTIDNPNAGSSCACGDSFS